MLPESFINELRFRCDILQVVGSYVSLTRAGRYYKGLCPFHSEKTPSFIVYPDTQSFYCFGCGAGGDVITFIKKIENLEYMEAVRLLAQKAGMAMPEDALYDDGYRRKTRTLEINREAARFFNRSLMSDTGKNARAYLVARGLTKATVTRFGIGYADGDWHSLCNYLKKAGYSDDEMIDAGVAGRSKNGGSYDLYRERVIFPIIDLRGNVIAFGGRNLRDGPPKYINTGDTPVFKKSRGLFALNFAKNSRSGRLILTEGYMDTVSLHQAGFDCAIASCGTALTSEQARLAAQYANEVVIAYDSDEAGQKATRKAVSLLDEAGVKVKILSLSGAKDPDEFIKKYGAERFEMLLSGSAGATDFQIAKLKKENDISTDEGKIGFLKGFVSLMSGGISRVEREVYVSKICRELEVDKNIILTQITAAEKKLKAKESKKEYRELKPFTYYAKSGTDRARQLHTKYVLAEEGIIAYLMRNPDSAEKIGALIKEENIVSDIDREIYAAVMQRLCEDLPCELINLSGILSTEAMSKLTSIITAEVIPISETVVEEYIDTLLSFKGKKEQSEIIKLEGEDLKKFVDELSATKK